MSILEIAGLCALGCIGLSITFQLFEALGIVIEQLVTSWRDNSREYSVDGNALDVLIGGSDVTE